MHPSGNTIPFSAVAIAQESFCCSTPSAPPWKRDVAAPLVLGVRLSQGSKGAFHQTPLCKGSDSWLAQPPPPPVYKASDPADLEPFQSASHQSLCLTPSSGRATPRGTSQNLGRYLGGLSSSSPPREEGFQASPPAHTLTEWEAVSRTKKTKFLHNPSL